MLFLTKNDYDKILKHCEAGLPDEACGLIGGTKEGNDKYIKKVYLLTNIDHSNEHFSMDPKEQLQAVKDMRQNGLELLGPSERDCIICSLFLIIGIEKAYMWNTSFSSK